MRGIDPEEAAREEHTNAFHSMKQEVLSATFFLTQQGLITSK